MSLTNIGAEALASVLIGDGEVSLFNALNAAIGVGNESDAFSVDQTELAAEESSGGSSLRKEMDSGYPMRDPEGDDSDNVIRFRSTFTESEANFRWLEWGVFNSKAEGGGTMLLRVIEDLGVKSNDTWVFEVDITISTT